MRASTRVGARYNRRAAPHRLMEAIRPGPSTLSAPATDRKAPGWANSRPGTPLQPEARARLRYAEAFSVYSSMVS